MVPTLINIPDEYLAAIVYVGGSFLSWLLILKYELIRNALIHVAGAARALVVGEDIRKARREAVHGDNFGVRIRHRSECGDGNSCASTRSEG